MWIAGEIPPWKGALSEGQVPARRTHLRTSALHIVRLLSARGGRVHLPPRGVTRREK